MVSPQKIEYNGVFSTILNPLDIILDVAFESDNGATSSYLNRSAVAAESYDGRYKNTYRYKYDELFTPKFTIVKKDFSDFTQDEVRQVLKYLTSTDKPALLQVYYDVNSNSADWTAIGGWTSIETYKISNSRTVGIVATFEAITPFAMSALHRVEKRVSTPKDTMMYSWTITSVANNVPENILSYDQDLLVGDKLYTFTGDLSSEIKNGDLFFYGTISNKSGNTYTVNDVNITLSTPEGVIMQDMDNKIIINIDTDDNKPVYPRITINHGYGTETTPHTIVSLPSDVTFNSIIDMADYVENTVYHNEKTGTYYYKSYTPVFTSSNTLPEYVNWTIVDVDHAYTSADTFATNTFYYYKYGGIYYWKTGDTINEDISLPIYGDWTTKEVDRKYTEADIYEEKTIYYNASESKYYWMSPYNFYKKNTPIELSTTSVKITNTHSDILSPAKELPPVIIKNDTSKEKIVIDGANKIVSSDRTRRIFGDDFNWNWLELHDGKNEIVIEGNCEILIEYRTVIKCGEH